VQRFGVLRRTLELLALDRPLIVCCDDADDSPDVLKLARQLLAVRERSKAPVLLLVSVSRDVGDPELVRHLEALELHEASATIDLQPFVGPDRRALVHAVADLHPDLERRIAERTAGNPLHAVQWVSDLVARDRLVPADHGHAVRPGGLPEPDATADVWDRRIRSVVAGIEAPAMTLFERAAVSGVAVDVFEWQAACDDPGGAHAAQGRAMFHPRLARVRAAILESLLESGLARQTESGFVFSHRDLQRALVQRAKDAGRYREHAAAYGSTLEHRVPDAGALRCARFHVEAGHQERALPLLLRAETWERRTRGPAASLATLTEVERILRSLRLGDDDPRWVELLTRRAEAEEEAGDWVRAGRTAGDAHVRARRAKLAELDARAQMVLGAAALAGGDPSAAEEHWQRVARLLGDEGPVVETVKVWRWLRRLAAARGDRGEMARRGERVRAACGRASGAGERVPALLALAEHLSDTGDLGGAAGLAAEVVELANERRDHAAAAKAWSLAAEVAERGADLGAARDGWMHAVELLDDLGDDRRAALARCRWGFVEAKDRRWQVARTVVDAAIGAADREPRVAAGVAITRAAAAAGRGNWGLVDRELEAAATALPNLRSHELVFAQFLEYVADLCEAGGHPRRARVALLLARDRLVAARRADAAQLVVERLDRTP
jgi:tetratricopeptide (TPR) repeat protein